MEQSQSASQKTSISRGFCQGGEGNQFSPKGHFLAKVGQKKNERKRNWLIWTKNERKYNQINRKGFCAAQNVCVGVLSVGTSARFLFAFDSFPSTSSPTRFSNKKVIFKNCYPTFGSTNRKLIKNCTLIHFRISDVGRHSPLKEKRKAINLQLRESEIQQRATDSESDFRMLLKMAHSPSQVATQRSDLTPKSLPRIICSLRVPIYCHSHIIFIHFQI